LQEKRLQECQNAALVSSREKQLHAAKTDYHMVGIKKNSTNDRQIAFSHVPVQEHNSAPAMCAAQPPRWHT
jgi:hypothetical protein